MQYETSRAATAASRVPPAAPRSPSEGWRHWLCIPVFWAALGVLCLVFQIWVFARWAADGNLHAYPSGGYDISGARKAVTWITQTLSVLGCLLLVLLCLRQSRAAGRITMPTALAAGYFLCFWLSPYSGAQGLQTGQDRYALNVMTWAPYLPWWDGPLPQIETPLLLLAAYPLTMYWVLLAMAVASWLQRRRPDWSVARVTAAIAVICFAYDLPMEQIYINLGGYAYSPAVPGFTLFQGQWYQLPLSSPAGLLLLELPPVLMVLHARNGREAWLLDGSLRLPRRAQPWIRLFAGVGFVSLGMLLFLLWMMLASLGGQHADLPSWIDRPGV